MDLEYQTKKQKREMADDDLKQERETIRHAMLTVLQNYSASPSCKTRAAAILLTLDGIDLKDNV